MSADDPNKPAAPEAGSPLPLVPAPSGPVKPPDGRSLSSAQNGKLGGRPPRPKASEEPDAPALPMVSRVQFEKAIAAIEVYEQTGKKVKFTRVAEASDLNWKTCQRIHSWVVHMRGKGLSPVPAWGTLYESIRDAAQGMVAEGLKDIQQARTQFTVHSEKAKATLDETQQLAAANALAAEQARQKAAELEKQARDQAAQAQTQEGQLVQSVRTMTIVQLSQIQKAARSLPALGNKLETTMAAMGADPNVTLDQLLNVLERFGKISQKTAELGQLALELQRLSIGAPTEIIAHVASQTQSLAMNEQEALEEIARAQDAAQRYERNNSLNVKPQLSLVGGSNSTVQGAE